MNSAAEWIVTGIVFTVLLTAADATRAGPYVPFIVFEFLLMGSPTIPVEQEARAYVHVWLGVADGGTNPARKISQHSHNDDSGGIGALLVLNGV